MDQSIKAALIGTANCGEVVIDPEHPVANLANLVDVDDESKLLLFLGARSTFDRAGQKPFKMERMLTAPPEAKGASSGKVVALIRNALVSDSHDLLKEFANLLVASGLSFPHELLPDLLALKNPVLQQQIQTALGERGKWLASFHPEWKWAIGQEVELSTSSLNELKQRWEFGKIQERTDALAYVRRTTPAEAREWLASDFNKEKPAHRLRFLEVLLDGLSGDDTDFLEQVVEDRSEPVKQLAARFLAYLPRTELAQRMEARATELIRQGGESLICDPPENLPKDWAQDGIPKQVPSGRGKRAFWAESLISLIRPAFWTEHLEISPSDLIRQILDDNFATVVVRGWTNAVLAFRNLDVTAEEWLEPLWKDWSDYVTGRPPQAAGEAYAMMQQLIPNLPATLVERTISKLLTNLPDPTEFPMEDFLNVMQTPWSAKFGAEYLKMTRLILQSRSDNAAYRWAGTLLIAAKSLPVECFAAAFQPWVIKDANAFRVSGVERQVNQFVELLKLRQSFYAELTPEEADD